MQHKVRADFAGCLNTSTSPSAPATVLYRGASFDVLNPHASLVPGSHNFETPAEIDGLLDSYFEVHDENTQDNMYDNTAAAGDSSPASSHVPSEGSRRVLYDNVKIAHRNILRTRGCDKSAITPPPRALLVASDSQKAGRPFSDPFDLTISEKSSCSTLLTRGQVLQENRRNDATASPRMQPKGLGITDPDETHAYVKHISRRSRLKSTLTRCFKQDLESDYGSDDQGNTRRLRLHQGVAVPA
jgi:hypothetical protein